MVAFIVTCQQSSVVLAFWARSTSTIKSCSVLITNSGLSEICLPVSEVDAQ